MKIKITKNCKCGKEFEIERTIKKDGSFRINKKEQKCCSRKCANGHLQSKETKQKISTSLFIGNYIYCSSCKKKIRHFVFGTFCYKCSLKIPEYQKIRSEYTSKALKGKTGGLRRGSGRGKKGWYKGYWCDSSWELAYVIYNLDFDIKFKRNHHGFNYIFNCEVHKYYPDFILENDTYVEIKGYLTEKVREKIRQFSGKLELITSDKITLYLEYVINKYGKNYIYLYEN